ncbi:hypothetical protein SLEP1_g3836 [Rubroshorea leprosula]|uniref:Uncharacterized protein n=1 Tax=Rubroshorea leprosula TaxID=152421 RepID=A0AAV5HLS5_9ROSI|nr:hypothetical protein SLEP1_g3836 [Rubroshorea leprosula]
MEPRNLPPAEKSRICSALFLLSAALLCGDDLLWFLIP